jgi:hypothetical protein
MATRCYRFLNKDAKSSACTFYIVQDKIETIRIVRLSGSSNSAKHLAGQAKPGNNELILIGASSLKKKKKWSTQRSIT